MQLNRDHRDDFLDDEYQFNEYQEEFNELHLTDEQQEFEDGLIFVDPLVLDNLPNTINPYSHEATDLTLGDFYYDED